MSRIRTVKPEFWTSEQVITCSPQARLLFIGLWNFCDDNGVHSASYVRLKAEIFPGDSLSTMDIKQWVEELIQSGLIQEYLVEDTFYWIVTGFKTHQRIDKPTYRHPLPQSKNFDEHSNGSWQTLDDFSTIPQRQFLEQSPTILGVLDEHSTTERNGMESNGKEKDICEVETSACSPLEDKLITSNPKSNVSNKDVQAIFLHWQQVMKCPKAKLDKKRRDKIEAALDLGYSVEDLKRATEGCAHIPFNMGVNDRSQKYNGIDLIFRDAEHIERFMTAEIAPESSPVTSNSNALFAGVI